MNHDKSIDNIYKLDGKVPVGKAIPFAIAAYIGDVCGKYRSDSDRCRCLWAVCGADDQSCPMCDDDCRYRQSDPALPSLEDWIRSSHRNGNQFYFREYLSCDRTGIRLRKCRGCDTGRWSCRRYLGTFC